MMAHIITGFHAIEETLKNGAGTNSGGKPRLLYAKPGPRVKKILEQAKERGIPSSPVTESELDRLVVPLAESAREHRGLVLIIDGATADLAAAVSFDDFIARKLFEHKQQQNSDTQKSNEEKVTSLVVILDSITDPHNLGAVLRSCDQFGVELVIMPEHNSVKDGGIVARSSAGASAWVPQCTVANVTRAAEKLKNCGYWIYGAQADGVSLQSAGISGKVALVLGSEGEGISRLLREKCDTLISIPTRGKLDSLNVSVACGIALYEIRRNG